MAEQALIVAELKRIGRPDLFDFFAGHPYDPMGWNDPRNQWHMTYRYGDRAAGDTMREVLDANGMASVLIISTEYANAQQFTDETSQANDLAPKLAMVKPTGLHAGFFFTTNPNAWPQYQLYNPDGSKRKSWYLVRDAAKNTSF